jgi:hypothetical protein
LSPAADFFVAFLFAFAGQALGVSLIRFIPKHRSLRPITNMSHRPEPGKKSINMLLTKLFQALLYETSVDPTLCGCSAFGIDDIHTKLKAFKENRAVDSDCRPLYFVKTDVVRCFDTINQMKLVEIVKRILMKRAGQQLCSKYVSRKYVTVHVAGKQLKRIFHQVSTTQSSFFLLLFLLSSSS